MEKAVLGATKPKCMYPKQKYLDSGHSATIRTYAAYLIEKVHVFGELQRDPVRTGVEGRDGYLRTLPLSKGLLHHVSCLQKQIGTLLACKFYVDELSNEVTIGAFALLVQDLLRLFQAMNEGVINILQHFFEMGKDEARLGLKMYKVFAEQTTKSMEYFSVAKRMEAIIHINIPQLKHAPLSLVRTLEEYVNSPDFEEEQKSAAKTKSVTPSKSTVKSPTPKSPVTTKPSAKDDDDPWSPKKTTEESKQSSSKKDMIDFFSSIDNEETTIQQTSDTFQAQMLAGNDFQQFQLQLQQQSQLFQMQQMQAEQNMMLQNQFTGMAGSQNFQPNMLAAQPTGFNTNPFSSGQQQPGLFQNNMSNNGSMVDMMGANSMNNGGMNSIAPQNTGNPFRLGPSAIGSLPTPSMPMMTGSNHFNTMPNLSSHTTGATNPFAPSTNPLNPFSPNFGKVPAQPTGMMGMNNSIGSGMNGGLNAGSDPMGGMNNNLFGNNSANNNNNMGNMGMMSSQPTGLNGNPWGQQQQPQQTGFGHQGQGSSFM
ncbi:hypothetical protein BGZ80_007624 [Entomortierella chlamydospora]|uniref:AP180 N-terminal homology (ANTH) domain-containing protein n=1 Tax=Entomortierella chlamydospora TaxID=101097 RepID=A0A9P6MY79_9FUNG|nr:hypothetical protein BGZ80_007624 [Entomortierella chlamydospora]